MLVQPGSEARWADRSEEKGKGSCGVGAKNRSHCGECFPFLHRISWMHYNEGGDSFFRRRKKYKRRQWLLPRADLADRYHTSTRE